MDYLGRIKHLQEDFEAPLKAPGQGQAVDAVYISNLPNVRYLCGFTGSNGALLVGPHAAWFLTDGRYRTQAADEVMGAEVEVYGLPDQLGSALRRIAGELGATRVGFEADHVAVAAAERLKEHFPGAELVPTSGLVEGLRRVKEPEELDRIRAAAQLAEPITTQKGRGRSDVSSRYQRGKRYSAEALKEGTAEVHQGRRRQVAGR